MCTYFNQFKKSVKCKVFLHPFFIRYILFYKESSIENIIIDIQTLFINSDSKAKVLKEMRQCYIHRKEPIRLSLLQI